MRTNNEKKYEIRVTPDDPELIMEVWVRDISFLDIQRAAQEIFDVAKDGQMTLNLEGYWKYAFSTWVTKTNPNLSQDELINLTGYVGEQIAAVLPNPEQLGQMMSGGFTKGDKP
tara:strand:+ start:1267 stop:1608 length:342 start_codon:yes stop_codon:yes gene_type:complete